MAKTYTLTVFNTCTSQYEKVEATKEVYNEFRRGEWRIEKNDDIVLSKIRTQRHWGKGTASRPAQSGRSHIPCSTRSPCRCRT